MEASDGKLTAEVRGEVETEDKVLVLRRIRVVYRLQAPAELYDSIARVHAFHARYCPIYRSLAPAIDITTELEIVGGAPADSPQS